MYSFNYVRPSSVAEAVKALNGGNFLSGGMTLLPSLKMRLARPETLVDLAGIAELTGITIEGDRLCIGAMTRHSDVASSADIQRVLPALAELAGGIGDPLVRNRGTIGGSIANSDPSADYPAAAGLDFGEGTGNNLMYPLLQGPGQDRNHLWCKLICFYRKELPECTFRDGS